MAHAAAEHAAARVWIALHVLELASLRDRALADDRNYDDQAEWLDERTLVYGHHEQRITGDGPPGVNIWSIAIDGTSPPRRLIAGASSPAVVR